MLCLWMTSLDFCAMELRVFTIGVTMFLSYSRVCICALQPLLDGCMLFEERIRQYPPLLDTVVDSCAIMYK